MPLPQEDFPGHCKGLHCVFLAQYKSLDDRISRLCELSFPKRSISVLLLMQIDELEVFDGGKMKCCHLGAQITSDHLLSSY